MVIVGTDSVLEYVGKVLGNRHPPMARNIRLRCTQDIGRSSKSDYFTFNRRGMAVIATSQTTNLDSARRVENAATVANCGEACSM